MRILHTMIRVGNIDRLINFYTRVLGMILFRKNGYSDGQFTLVLVGYGNKADSAVVGPTHNRGVDAYEIDAGYSHIVIEVDDAYQACSDICNNGGQVIRKVGPTKHSITVITFVTDPDGYKIELIQRSS